MMLENDDADDDADLDADDDATRDDPTTGRGDAGLWCRRARGP
jgi:hypothetical protein